MTQLSTITLPDDIIWEDEHDWVSVRQSVTRTAGGRAVVQHGSLLGGRPVTLTCHWLSKATLDALIVLRDTAGATMSLTLPDARVLTVMFRNQDSDPIKATPIIDYAQYEATDNFDVTLKLMEI